MKSRFDMLKPLLGVVFIGAIALSSFIALMFFSLVAAAGVFLFAMAFTFIWMLIFLHLDG